MASTRLGTLPSIAFHLEMMGTIGVQLLPADSARAVFALSLMPGG